MMWSLRLSLLQSLSSRERHAIFFFRLGTPRGVDSFSLSFPSSFFCQQAQRLRRRFFPAFPVLAKLACSFSSVEGPPSGKPLKDERNRVPLFFLFSAKSMAHFFVCPFPGVFLFFLFFFFLGFLSLVVFFNLSFPFFSLAEVKRLLEGRSPPPLFLSPKQEENRSPSSTFCIAREKTFSSR